MTSRLMITKYGEIHEEKALCADAHCRPADRVTNDVPEAWAVKDYADGWIICRSLAEAKREVDNGHLIVHLVQEKPVSSCIVSRHLNI